MENEATQIEGEVRAEKGEEQEKHVPQEFQECVFCKILAKQLPAMVVEENSSFMAVLEINPKAIGHVLVFPKRHIAHFEEMDMKEMAEYAHTIKSVVRKMRRKLYITGYTVVSQNGFSSGQMTGHFVTHIIPTYSSKKVDMNLLAALPTLDIPPAVMEDTFRRLRE